MASSKGEAVSLFPKIKKDWRSIITRAWSVRLLIGAGVLSGCEVAIPFIQPIVDIPTGVFAALSGLTTCAALIARVLVQRKYGAKDGD